MTRIDPAGDVDLALARLRRLHPRLIDLSLDRIERLLARLGDPEKRLPPVLHVAGTNGKGSLIAFLRAGLEAAGYGVHAYTSPHLVRFNERIRLAGEMISDIALIELLERIEEANGGETITEFEITTAAALLAFAEARADILLLETGLGGRYDATNVVAAPLLTAITPISQDHEQFLGAALDGIAREKAGILKPGTACVLGPQPIDALNALRVAAAELGAPLIEHGQDWSVQADGSGLTFADATGEVALPLPGLPGAHQLDNAGLAIACLRHLPAFAIGHDAEAGALTDVAWPARMQRLTRGPLAQLLAPGAELWLDGGHNPAAGAAVAALLSDWQGRDTKPRPLHLVLALLKSKDAAGFLAPFAELAPVLWPVRMAGEHEAYGGAELAQVAGEFGFEARLSAGVEAAVGAIAAAPTPAAPRILIAGSLYLAGDVLADNS